ncbi:MAG: hypothetical protein E6J47_08990 [Chloroflexi bacterium]|nr:MAG: hypothetical protein E6J47_08990 [Chloroflexota bacterium]
MRRSLNGGAILLAFFCAQACGNSRDRATTLVEIPADFPGPETRAFVTTLQQRGARVALSEVVPRSTYPYLRTRAVKYFVDGETIDVREYSSEGLASADASGISPDGGSFRTNAPGSATEPGIELEVTTEWVLDPHYYRSGRLIVLYAGKNASLISLFTSILGPQIAGR